LKLASQKGNGALDGGRRLGSLQLITGEKRRTAQSFAKRGSTMIPRVQFMVHETISSGLRKKHLGTTKKSCISKVLQGLPTLLSSEIVTTALQRHKLTISSKKRSQALVISILRGSQASWSLACVQSSRIRASSYEPHYVIACCSCSAARHSDAQQLAETCRTREIWSSCTYKTDRSFHSSFTSQSISINHNHSYSHSSLYPIQHHQSHHPLRNTN
jgi:hypothetical protein